MYSPKETNALAGCNRDYTTSLERSGILVPHRYDIASDSKDLRPLVYYDATQVKTLTAMVKLRDFLCPQFLSKLVKEDRFLQISDQLVQVLCELSNATKSKVVNVEPLDVDNFYFFA